MVRDDRLDEPDADAVAAAVRRTCSRPVDDAEPVSKGINAIYRVTFGDADRAVLKAATFNTAAELRPEPRLLELVARETTVPVPDVVATVEDGGPLGVFHYLLDHVEGRQVRSLARLPPGVQERLVREVGRHLARIHGCRPVETCGPLRVSRDDSSSRTLATAAESESWGEVFASLADLPLDLFEQVHGGDDPGRFADLVPEVTAAFDGVERAIEPPAAPTLLHGDFHLDNFVLAPDDDADRLVRAVLDFGDPYVGDFRFDLAYAEDAMVNVHLPVSDRADHLRDLLRTAYARERGIDREEIADERYAYYLLLQRCRWMAVAVDWDDWEDPAAVERAYRSFVADRLAEIG